MGFFDTFFRELPWWFKVLWVGSLAAGAAITILIILALWKFITTPGCF